MATAMQAWNTAEAAAWAQYQAASLAAEQAWAAAADAAMVEYYADIAVAATAWNTDEASYRATLAADVASAESAWDTDEASAFATFEGVAGSEAGDYRQTLEEPWTVSQVTETLVAANAPDARQLAAASPNQRTQQTPPPAPEQLRDPRSVQPVGEPIGGFFNLLKRVGEIFLKKKVTPKDVADSVKDAQRVSKGTDASIQRGQNALNEAYKMSFPDPRTAPNYSSPSSAQQQRQGPTP